MKKITVAVEAQIPDGFEYFEHRKAKHDERWVTGDDLQIQHGSTAIPVFIIRPVLVFPDWVPIGVWYAMDKDGDEYLFEDKPELVGAGFWAPSDDTDGMPIKRNCIKFPTFYCEDWRESLRQNVARQ